MQSTLHEISEKIRKQPKLVVADDFEIAIQNTRSFSTEYQQGDARSELQLERTWVSLRVLHRKRGGRAVWVNPSLQSVPALVEAAFESANRAAVDPWFRFPLWKQMSASTMPEQPEFEREQQMPASLYGFAQGTCERFRETYQAATVATYLQRKSEKFSLFSQRQAHFGEWSLLGVGADGVHWSTEQRAALRPTDWTDWLKGRIDWMQQCLRSPAKGLMRGPRTALLGPQAVAPLLQELGKWFSADRVQAGLSPVGAKINEKVFSSEVSIVDDATLEESPWSASFDLEGVLGQRTPLLEAGVVKNCLYDVYTATRENRLSTGNLFISGGSIHPRIGTSNICLLSGKAGRQAMLDEIKAGVWVDQLNNIDPVRGKPGHYRVDCSGWRIVHGHLHDRFHVTGCQIDLIDLFTRVSAVGRDAELIGGVRTPSILCDKLPLGN